MARNLDPTSRGIIEFRPNIAFVEPEVVSPPIDPVDEPQVEEAPVEQIKQLANAVDVLAAAIQARVDDKAKDMVIDVDPDVDIGVVQAMERHFPDNNPLEITYDQYKECKDNLLAMGEEIGKQAIIAPEEVALVKDDAIKANKNESSLVAAQMGGFGTPDAARGNLRPEVQKRGQIIKPLDIKKLQLSLICILVNFIWKNFILKALDKADPPGLPSLGSIVRKAVGEKLCDPGGKIKIPDLFILGDKLPAILKGKNQPKIPTGAPEK